MPYPHLLAPVRLRGLELANRVLLPAMGTGFAAADGSVTDRLVAYHVARVRGGCALTVTEAASVRGQVPHHLDISSDARLPGLCRLAAAIHAAGGRVAVQLWDGAPDLTDEPGESPHDRTAAVGEGSPDDRTAAVVGAFAAAADRAVAAGFDALEVDCTRGSSLWASLSPATPQDGDVAGRAAHALAVIRVIRTVVPDDMPLLLRIDAHDDRPGGMSLDDVVAFCRMAGMAGVDVVDVAHGGAAQYLVPPIDVPRGFTVTDTATIRHATGLLTVASGRINAPDQAETILAVGLADLVAIGRGQLADPDFVAKAAANRPEDIVRCVACDQGCYDRYVDPAFGEITCLRNPVVGREAEGSPSQTLRPLRVLVAGGGVAGMEAALVLAERGHKPVLVEASDHLGGQLEVAGAAPRKDEMASAARSRARQVARAGVEIRVGTPVTPSVVDEIAPEVVIDATGARPIHPAIPGADRENVTDAIAVLTGRVRVRGAAVVVGGGLVGLEAAEFLAERGVPVTVVESLDDVGAGLGPLRRTCVLEALSDEGVEQLTGTTVVAVRAGSVVVEQHGLTREVPCDTVVLAVGARPDDHTPLARHCARRGIAYHVVGDALRARRALDAIAEANALARAL